MTVNASCSPHDVNARFEGLPAADVVVKIGGSACTMKSEFETLNEPALAAAAAQLSQLARERRVAIVHGAGSFGHHQAKEFEISKGCAEVGVLPPRLREGFAKTRLSVMTLHHHVLQALIGQGLPATMSPCPFVETAGGRLPTGAADGARMLLARGLVPVIHGDAVLDTAQGCAILSGDVWMSELCRELGAKTAVFLTDVDGVFTRPPTEHDAQLISELFVDPATGEVELADVELRCATHDVTGGIATKLRCAADVLRSAPSVETVHIVRVGSASATRAMRGAAPEGGTTLRRKA